MGGRVSQWVAAHEELTLLARRRAELDGLEGPALLRALRAGVHRHLGLESFAEYVERLFGYAFGIGRPTPPYGHLGNTNAGWASRKVVAAVLTSAKPPLRSTPLLVHGMVPCQPFSSAASMSSRSE